MKINLKKINKKNSERKNVAWFGYKAHLAVDTQNQYILQTLMSSASLSDGKGAIPLLKEIHETLHLPIRYGILNAGYDFKSIYQQLHNMNAQGIFAYNLCVEQEVEGVGGNFAPTCVRECSYQYEVYFITFQLMLRLPLQNLGKSTEFKWIGPSLYPSGNKRQ
ncbi:transposase [Bacillus solimangrovi]|uniref:Transposase IS4-like domain-containing protein n=1 Tax=Bacillus solimangrovi TaxID=1305675 RepID=A0A1E5LAF1_9BACI|nr:transposase [Bacillus solimangrovi]OEH91076.1 hypothetical protein BFG57_06800 [Bacillus solimangrovi]